MANENGWGDGSVNNAIGWGQGANNAISWGKSHLDSWSGATDIDGGNAPVNTVAPAITGTAQEGQTLTCSTGTWSGSPTYTYQWKRNGNNIGSATNSTYTLVTADVGQSIKCTVTATNFSGSANADSNTVVPISAFSFLLDTYSGAAVAYSLRKLRSAYSGSAIRVRRSSDNAEQDFGFVNNVLDTASLLTFCGAGNGFVTTWYDQSGNALNSSMSTAANQPRIVNAGVLDVKNLKSGFKFDGSNDYLTSTALTALNSGNTYSIFSVAANETTGVAGDIINTNNGSSRLNLFNFTATTGGIYRIALIQNTLNAVYSTNFATADGTANQRLQTVVVNGFNIAGWKDGVAGSTDTYTGIYANNRFDIGAYLGVPRYLNGYIQELVIYPSNQTTNRTGIESNINSYYGIY